MASDTFYPSDVELHESEIAKPSPLRIVKRNQTIPNSSPGRETLSGQRGTSGGSNESMGTPPGGDRPLTVRKKRMTRASISDWGLEEPLSEMTPENLNKLNSIWKVNGQSSPRDDPDLTPKAKASLPRTISAGAFLKSELHRRSLDIEAGRHSVRGQRHSLYTREEDVNRRHPYTPAQDWSPTILQRRPSKPKNFFLRAIGGRSSEEVKRIKRSDSTISKNTLIRRLSRSKKRPSGSYDASCEDNDSSVSTESSVPPESFDIADVGIKSRMSCGTPSCSASDTTSITYNENVLILSPQIKITPEVTSLANGACDLWVAVEVTGVLHKADGREASPFLSHPKAYESNCHGKLHSMEIELYPGRECQIAAVIGSLHRVPTISAHETHLVLAKILFSKATSSRHVREASSADLIAQLETDLGDTMSSYLSVRITYQHSGFPNHKSSFLNAQGLSSYFTHLQTETTAVIRRHNPQSAWSPRTSQSMPNPLAANPLVRLIETHFPPDRARESLKRLADERSPIPMAKRSQHLPGSSEETVKPTKSNIIARIDSTISSSLVSSMSLTPSTAKLSGPFARLPKVHSSKERASSETEVDPARQIWTEMRRNSRGGRSRHARASISADHYFSLDEETSPSRESSGNTSISTISSGLGAKRKAGDIDQERSRIMEVALRNKRSVGAETLRSMAPSVVQMGTSTGGKGKGGPLGSLGVGLGRTWGWGPPWW
ncbi:hypothetical protein N431DRAFT_497542 [Stipitochalara longipes BDJ]|nr:hypothetical protein N431DRAFT_497542 [Stipitochalara longipes BDJ]